MWFVEWFNSCGCFELNSISMNNCVIVLFAFKFCRFNFWTLSGRYLKKFFGCYQSGFCVVGSLFCVYLWCFIELSKIFSSFLDTTTLGDYNSRKCWAFPVEKQSISSAFKINLDELLSLNSQKVIIWPISSVKFMDGIFFFFAKKCWYSEIVGS